MALTTSMFTGLTGLTSNSTYLDVVGNNIANVNTTAFKKSRISFETQIQRTLMNGSGPSGEFGGTNPAQVGLGTKVASITKDFSSGPLQPTGVATDMALEGPGFFVVNNGGSTQYTRAGNFTLDSEFNLVSGGGGVIQGYGIDGDYNIVEGVMTNVNIPLGVMTIAEPTTEVKFAGNLNAGGDVATQGSTIESAQLFSDNLATTSALGTTAITSLFDAAGTQLFSNGDLITISGATRGGATLDDRTFEVGTNTQDADATGSTLDDFLTFLDDILGIDSNTGTAGVTLVGGVITVEGNTGGNNDIELENANIIVNQATAPALPFDWTKTQTADGESTRTTYLAYDSLGNELHIDMTMVLESKDSSGTTWRFYSHSEDDTDLDAFLTTGTVSFDTEGQLVTATDTTLIIDRQNTGAVSPQTIDLSFRDPYGSVTSLRDVNSQLSSLSQDGVPIGTLQDFDVAADGTVNGVFSNSLLISLGRIPVAMFANSSGLRSVGGSMFQPTTNSGTAAIVTAGSAGSGQIVGRSVELSNVELAEEFINLISASTGFSANSRIISTSEQLIQELLATVR